VSGPEDLVLTIAGEGVRDPRLLDALRAVPRADFVPTNLAEQAYEDKPLPIPHDQVTTQPSLVARMVDALGLAGSERGASRVREPGRLRDGRRRCPSRRTGVPSGPGCFLARRP
jgi:hypothetical protein